MVILNSLTPLSELEVKDLTVFDASTQRVNYQFEITGAEVSPTACNILISREGEADQASPVHMAENLCSFENFRPGDIWRGHPNIDI